MTYQQRKGPRAEYRELESQRYKGSVTLAEKFARLKSLAVHLAHYNSSGVTKSTETKYTFNLHNARSVFRFDCQNSECIRGDYDLSEDLALAVAAGRTTATGEMRCQGWLSKTTIDTVRCNNLLRYTLSLGY